MRYQGSGATLPESAVITARTNTAWEPARVKINATPDDAAENGSRGTAAVLATSPAARRGGIRHVRIKSDASGPPVILGPPEALVCGVTCGGCCGRSARNRSRCSLVSGAGCRSFPLIYRRSGRSAMQSRMVNLCGYVLHGGMWVHLQVKLAPPAARCYRRPSGPSASRQRSRHLHPENTQRACPHVHVALTDQPARLDDLRKPPSRAHPSRQERATARP